MNNYFNTHFLASEPGPATRPSTPRWAVLLASLLIVTSPDRSRAAERAADYAEATAKAAATGHDIAVFLYGSDWSRAGQELKQNVWDSEALATAAGDGMVLLAVDHPEGLATRQRNEAISGLMEKFLSTPARIVEARGEMGTVLEAQTDGSVLATTLNPTTEVYSLELKATEETADILVVDFWPDDTLPHRGPGRASNGNFVITEIEAWLVEGKNHTALPFAAAWTDRLYKQAEGPHLVIDGLIDPKSYWNVGTHAVHEKLRLLLLPDRPLPAEADIRLKIHAVSPHVNHTPGRFTIATASAPELADLIRDHHAEQLVAVGNQGLPCGSLNYPAIFMLDSTGRMIGQKHGLSLADNVDSLSGWLRKTSETRRERDRLWVEAETATGPERAELLARGLDAIGSGPTGVYAPMLQEIKDADPPDTTHLVRRYTLNVGVIAAEAARLAKEDSPEMGAAHFESELLHPGNARLSPGQLQQIYFAQYNYYRGQEAYKARINEPLRRIGELDPLSALGYGCAGKVLMSDGPPSVRYGWAARHTQDFPVRLEIGNSLESLHTHFPTAGDYVVTLSLAGAEKLEVLALTLTQGDKEITALSPPAVLDATNRTARFHLSMPEPDPAKSLVLRFDCDGEKPSSGTLQITPDRPAPPEPKPSGNDGSKLVQLASTLQRELRRQGTKAKSDPSAALAKLAQDESYIHKLTQHEVLRLAAPAKLAPQMETEEGFAFLQHFFEDQEWMVMWLTCGPHSGDPAAELGHLAKLLGHDSTLAADPVFKRLATAIAVAGGGSIARYDYFKESHELGRLHRMFYEHPAWTMRFILGIDEANGRYLRDHYYMPLPRYGNIHYQAAYRLHNIFGDSIHGSGFYPPWQGLPRMQQIKYAGGVCGSLTTLGDHIFKAVGVPAQGMGEPGHRSYVVRTAPGHWSPRYSLANPKRTASFYGGLYEDLATMEKVWADLEALRRASIHLWQARLHAEASDGKPRPINPLQRAASGLALETHPLYLDAWREWINLAKSDPATKSAEWLGLTKVMVPAVAPLGQKVVLDLWRSYEANLVADQKPADMIDTHLAVQEIFLGQFPDGFPHLHTLLQLQAARLADDPEATGSFFVRVLDAHAAHPAYAQTMLNWGAELAGKHPAYLMKYADLLVRHLALESPDTDDAFKRLAFTKLLALARDKKEFAAYHRIAEVADKALPLDVPGERYLNDKQLESYPEIIPFPGKLLSGEGLVSSWQAAKYDKPLQHHRLLDPRGGYIHANPHKDAWVLLELPRPARISGLVVVNRFEAAPDDQIPLKVAVSGDGKSWTEVFVSEENAPLWRIDLRKEVVEARFIKVYTQREKPAYFQLRNLLVYGSRLGST